MLLSLTSLKKKPQINNQDLILELYLLIIFIRISEYPSGHRTFSPQLIFSFSRPHGYPTLLNSGLDHQHVINYPPMPLLESHLEREQQEKVKCSCGGVAALLRAAAPVQDRIILGGLCLSAAVLCWYCRLSAHVITKISVGEPTQSYTKVEKEKKKKAKARGGAVCKLNCSGQNKDLSFDLNPSHLISFKLFLSA